jgi:hypothetical protein
MKNLLSIALAFAFTASNCAALTCGIDCVHKSHSSMEHSASHHSLHPPLAEHDHNHADEPGFAGTISRAGLRSCGTHMESPAVVSPKRVVRMDEVSLPVEVSPQFLRTGLPDTGGQCEPPWQFSSPLSKPHSISLRI